MSAAQAPFHKAASTRTPTPRHATPAAGRILPGWGRCSAHARRRLQNATVMILCRPSPQARTCHTSFVAEGASHAPHTLPAMGLPSWRHLVGLAWVAVLYGVAISAVPAAVRRDACCPDTMIGRSSRFLLWSFAGCGHVEHMHSCLCWSYIPYVPAWHSARPCQYILGWAHMRNRQQCSFQGWAVAAFCTAR